MKKLVIPTDPRHAMDEVSVGAGSVFECVLVGVPANRENVAVSFGMIGDATANRIAAKPVPGGEWKVDAPSAFFPAQGKAHYHVTADDGRTYLGGGTLRVLPPVPPQPTPPNGNGQQENNQ